MKALRRIVIAVLAPGLLVLSACSGTPSQPGGQSTPTPTGTATAKPSPSKPSTTKPTTAKPTAKRLCDTKVESANPALRQVRFGRHGTYDRLAFDFCMPSRITLSTDLVNELREDGSGNLVKLKGNYSFTVRLTPADAHTTSGKSTVPHAAITVAGNNMVQYKLIGDFEGVVTYGVGVKSLKETATTMLTDPNDPRHVILYFDIGRQYS
jgi:hypothetical protein